MSIYLSALFSCYYGEYRAKIGGWRACQGPSEKSFLENSLTRHGHFAIPGMVRLVFIPATPDSDFAHHDRKWGCVMDKCRRQAAPSVRFSKSQEPKAALLLSSLSMNRLFRQIVVFSLLIVCAGAEQYEKPGPVQLNKDGRQWVEKTLKKLSLEEKVGQMLNVRYFTDFQNVDSDAYRQFRDLLRKYHIGSVVLTVHVDGPVLLRNPPLEVAAVANQLQHDSELPLLIAADFERGLASRVSSVPEFPDAMAFGAAGTSAAAEKFGAITARESRAIGIHWNLFPVADVNSNPQNPIINTRSFGEDPAQVGELVAGFIGGWGGGGVLGGVGRLGGGGG